MAERISTWIDLIKYPVLVVTILVCAIVAKHALKLEFGVVTELGTTGVKFAEKSRETGAALADLSGKVSALSVELEDIKKQMRIMAPHAVLNEEAAFAAAQTVSDQIARTAKAVVMPRSDKEPSLPLDRGFIWIGNFRNGWQVNKLADSRTGQPITVAPESIQPGSEFKVMGNMVIRDGIPENDAGYFKNKVSLGVLSRGSRVRILATPKGIDRKFAVQYWAEVELVPERAAE